MSRQRVHAAVSGAGVQSRARTDATASVLAGSWRSQPQRSLAISESELREAAQSLMQSGAGALAWWRIRNTGLAVTNIGAELRASYRCHVLRAGVYEERLQHLFRELRAKSIEPILFKGWAVARYYADNALRPYGDIDLLVEPTDFARATEILSQPAFVDWNCDLHDRSPDLHERSYDELHVRSQLVPLGNSSVRVLAHEDHLALLCAHFIRHGAYRPVWLCDIAAAVEAAGPNFNWDVCLSGDAHRARWIIAALQVARDVLGADCVAAPAEASEKPPRWLVRALFTRSDKPSIALTPMRRLLRRGQGLWTDIRERWPHPVLATLRRKGDPTKFPAPLGHQLAIFSNRASHFAWRLCTGRAKA